MSVQATSEYKFKNGTKRPSVKDRIDYGKIDNKIKKMKINKGKVGGYKNYGLIVNS